MNLYTAPGIGDALWSLMCIKNAVSEPINLYTYSRNNYSSHFLNDLKWLNSVNQFSKPFDNFNDFSSRCEIDYKMYKNMNNFYDIKKMNVCTNLFLEENNRIETFFKNIPVEFNLDWNKSKSEYTDAKNYKNSILIYTSTMSISNLSDNYKYTSRWKPETWEKLIENILNNIDNANIVWIGSTSDIGMKEYLETKKIGKQIKFILNKPATFIIPLFKMCKCFISYQSGMSCLSIIEKIPTYMMYFNTYKNLRYSWCPIDSINDEKIHKPVIFDDKANNIENIINWIYEQ